jgi:hypothetical protein
LERAVDGFGTRLVRIDYFIHGATVDTNRGVWSAGQERINPTTTTHYGEAALDFGIIGNVLKRAAFTVPRFHRVNPFLARQRRFLNTVFDGQAQRNLSGGRVENSRKQEHQHRNQRVAVICHFHVLFLIGNKNAVVAEFVIHVWEDVDI